MKNRFGFTLAEVLITLGIIGVVAALTTPALNSAVQKNKVGPSLRKFMSTMQTANEHILGDGEANVLTEIIGTSDEYVNQLKKYVSGKKGDAKPLKDIIFANNGDLSTQTSIYVIFTFSNGDAVAFGSYSSAKDLRDTDGVYKGKVANVFYDINGFDKKPNRLGKDVFQFLVDDSGIITPKGGRGEYKAYTSATEEKTWETGKQKCSSTTVGNGSTCAGSIADNDWKVIYKY